MHVFIKSAGTESTLKECSLSYFMKASKWSVIAGCVVSQMNNNRLIAAMYCREEAENWCECVNHYKELKHWISYFETDYKKAMKVPLYFVLFPLGL